MAEGEHQFWNIFPSARNSPNRCRWARPTGDITTRNICIFKILSC